MDRVLGSGPRCRGFKSRRAREPAERQRGGANVTVGFEACQRQPTQARSAEQDPLVSVQIPSGSSPSALRSSVDSPDDPRERFAFARSRRARCLATNGREEQTAPSGGFEAWKTQPAQARSAEQDPLASVQIRRPRSSLRSSLARRPSRTLRVRSVPSGSFDFRTNRNHQAATHRL